MKILVAVWNNFTHDKRVMNISNSLVKAGYHVDVVASKSKKGLKLFEQNSYTVHRIPLFSSLYSKLENSNKRLEKNNSTLRSFRTQIKNNKLRTIITAFLNWLGFNIGLFFKGLRIKPKIIYANDLDTLTISYFLAKIFRAKLIFDSHELWLYGNKYCNSTKLHKLLWKYIQRKLINKTDKVIVTTNYRKDTLSEQYNFKNIEVVQNCPNFQPVEAHNFFRQEYKISSDRVIILYQGLLAKKRGIFSIVDALEDLDNISIIFMGMGEDKLSLEEYVADKNLENKVFIKDAVKPYELIKYTSSADIGIQLLFNTDINHYSTISNKLLEYIMAGLAIVGSDFPEIRKILDENENGIVVDPSDTEQIREAIVKLVNDKELLKIYKENSKKNRHKYTWENEEKKLLSIVRRLK